MGGIKYHRKSASNNDQRFHAGDRYSYYMIPKFRILVTISFCYLVSLFLLSRGF